MDKKGISSNRQSFGARLRSLFFAPMGTTDMSVLIQPNDIDYGVNVTTGAALRFTAVFAAIKILSENIAALPKSVKVRMDGGFETASSHPAYPILAIRPNDYTDRFSFWFSLIANALSQGNGYAVIKFNSKTHRPESIHRVNPTAVKIIFENGQKIYKVEDSAQCMQWLNGTYLEHEMIHIMFFTTDGLTGIDPVTYNAISIGRGIATQKFSADFYRRGGQIKGTLETDGSLGDEEYNQFIRHYNKAAENFETPLLEYGIKYKSIGISPIAAQLIQTETLSIQDIARIYSVPPHLLADLSHATFSNIEQQNIYFASYSLRPLVKRIEEQLEQKLFTNAEFDNYSVKFDLKGMMRGDDASRSTYYLNGINSGWLTPNEARELEGMKVLPGLDKARVPLNTALVGDNGQIINPNNDTTE